MPGVSRLGDSVTGSAPEHQGHVPPHGTVGISGSISGGCSANVRCNGIAVAHVGSTTTENDSCCGSSSGAVGAGSPTVFVNGSPVARNGDKVNPHAGSVNISSGSANVIAN